MGKDNGEKSGKSRKTVELEPENARYHDSLGVTLHAEGRCEEAKKEVQKAAELETSSYKNSQ